MSDNKKAGLIATAIFLTIVAVASFLLWGMPMYRVWEQRLAGMAKLAEAESSRQIATQEAHAKMESAKMLAAAEVERAKGVAEANKIIGDSLKGNDMYLKYLWLQGLEHTHNSVIYIPTEANLPLLEAGKRPERKE